MCIGKPVGVGELRMAGDALRSRLTLKDPLEEVDCET